MLRRFQESGKGRRAFARENGIGLSTLGYWIRQEKRKAVIPAVSAPMVFSELRLNTQGVGSESAWAMEVVSPSGLRVRSREALPTHLLIRLLRERRC
jgi:hypothetical protein